jgi:hypothetical protein
VKNSLKAFPMRSSRLIPSTGSTELSTSVQGLRGTGPVSSMSNLSGPRRQLWIRSAW